MEYEYDYDPVGKEETNPGATPVEEGMNPNVVPVEDSYYYERPNTQPEYNPVVYDDYLEADNKKANRLCMWSLACALVPDFLLGVIKGVVDAGAEPVAVLLSAFSGLGHIASLVLMIYVRVKYPKNVFGKVLMWLYIIGIVLSIVAVILVMVFFFWFCNEVESGCGMLYVLPALLGGM